MSSRGTLNYATTPNWLFAWTVRASYGTYERRYRRVPLGDYPISVRGVRLDPLLRTSNGCTVFGNQALDKVPQATLSGPSGEPSESSGVADSRLRRTLKDSFI